MTFTNKNISIGDLIRCKDDVIFDEIIETHNHKSSRLTPYKVNSILMISSISYQRNKWTNEEYYEIELFGNMKYVKLVIDDLEFEKLLNNSYDLFERI